MVIISNFNANSFYNITVKQCTKIKKINSTNKNSNLNYNSKNSINNKTNYSNLELRYKRNKKNK